MTFATADAGVLIEGLDREQEVYVALRELSRRQDEIIASQGQVETLLEVLGRKQALLSEVEAIERRLRPVKDAWEQERETQPSELRVQVETRVRALRDVLGEVVALEERGRTELARQQQAVAAEIRNVGRTRQAHHAYAGGSVTPPSRRIDDTG